MAELTPGGSETTSAATGLKKPRWTQENTREVACNVTMAMLGWHDGGLGPLIPRIQSHYNISYTVVSTLFLGAAAGCLLAGFTLGMIMQRLPLGMVLNLGATVQIIAFVIIIPAPPFPVLPVAWALAGFGGALQDAGSNVYVASLPGSEHKLSYLHATYGIFATLAPLAAAAMVSHGIQWSYFFGLSLGLALWDFGVLGYAFKFSWTQPEEKEEAAPTPLEGFDVPLEGYGASVPATPGSEAALNPAEAEMRKAAEDIAFSKKSPLRYALRFPAVWLFSVFIGVYVGAEVSLGGWVVSYLIEERDGGPAAGYVSAGYFGGIAVGRLILSHFSQWVGETRVTVIYLVLCIGLEFAVWFPKSLIANAVVVAFIGVLMGPMFPLTISVATKALPRRIHPTAIGFIGAFGALGSAIFPFVVGALAQRFTTTVLQPVMIVLFSILLAAWLFVPRLEMVRKKIR